MCSNLSVLLHTYWGLHATQVRDVASALTLHACCTPVTSRPLESSTYSNISLCFIPQPATAPGTTARARTTLQAHRLSLGLCTRATSTGCASCHLHQGDLLPHNVVRHMIDARSCAQLEEMRFPCSSHLMQLGLKLTEETLLCGEYLALQSAVDDFSVGCKLGPFDGRAKLSWIVCGTLHQPSTTPPERAEMCCCAMDAGSSNASQI